MAAVWKEAKTPAGRPYYYKDGDNTTSWIKPDELLDAKERVAAQFGWRPTTDKDNNAYWHHRETNKTTWKLSPEIEKAFEQTQSQAPTFVTSTFNYESARREAPRDHPRDRDSTRDNHRDSRQGRYFQSGPSQSTQSSSEPVYATSADAEAAFLRLFRKAGVDASWTWAQAMKTLVPEPTWRAVPDPKKRRALFDSYLLEVSRQQRESEEQRIMKYRDDFKKMLRTHDEIHAHTSWKTAMPFLQQETVFRSNKSEKEKEKIFLQHTAELRDLQEKTKANTRETALGQLTPLFRELGFGPTTSLMDAKQQAAVSAAFKDNANFAALKHGDFLFMFRDYSRAAQNAALQHEKGKELMSIRRRRKHREAFVALLRELRADNVLTAASEWPDIVSRIKDDPRFKHMMEHRYDEPDGLLDPINLFLVEVDEDSHDMRPKRYQVLDILEKAKVAFSAQVPKEEYISRVNSVSNHGLSEVELDKVLGHLYKRSKIQSEIESQRSNESSSSDPAKDFYRRVRRADPPPGTTWEDFKSHARGFPEYRQLTERERVAEFNDAMDRISHHSHRSRDGRGNRDERSEPDAYQADRARAVAQRERQYQHGRASDHDVFTTHDRNYESRRSGRSSRDSPFDRSSRNGHSPPRRDLKRRPSRDGGYARADPYDKTMAQLDYDDASSRPTSKAGSTPGRNQKKGLPGDGGSEDPKRASKRQRTGKDAAVTTAVAEENLRSGSEEGEIEED